MELKEILEQMKRAEDKPNMSVTVKIEGEEEVEVVYTEDFLVLHVGKNHGSVIGCVGVVELMKAVEMLMNSVSGVMKRLPPQQQMMMSHVLLERMVERMKESERDEE